MNLLSMDERPKAAGGGGELERKAGGRQMCAAPIRFIRFVELIIRNKKLQRARAPLESRRRLHLSRVCAGAAHTRLV